MKKLLCIICLGFLSMTYLYAQNDEITNDLVIELLREGFTTNDIIGLIDNSSGQESHVLGVVYASAEGGRSGF